MRAAARDADQRKSVQAKGIGERVKVISRVRKRISPSLAARAR